MAALPAGRDKLSAMWPFRAAVVLSFLLLPLHAQTTPAELARVTVRKWTSGGGIPGLAHVIREGESDAVLALSGVPHAENSGDATIAGSHYSGIYDAHRVGSIWQLGRREPLE